MAKETATLAPDGVKPRHLGIGAGMSVISDVGTLLAAAAVSIVLARAIGPSANGTFALLSTLINIAVLVVSLGVVSGITYQVSNRGWSVRDALRTTLALAVGLGALGSAGSLGFVFLTKHSVMHDIAPHLAIIAICAITPALLVQFLTGILLGRDRYEGYAALRLLNAGLLLIGSAAIAVIFGLTGAIAGFTAATWLTAIVGMWLAWRWARRTTPSRTKSTPDVREPRHLREAFRFGLQSWPGNVLQQANYRLDLLILGGFASTRHVGLYSVGVTITEIAWIMPHGIQTVLFPRAASLDSAATAGTLTAEENDAAVARATRHSVLLVVPSGLIVVALLALVPVVYGAQFQETFSLGLILLPGVLVLGVGKVIGSVISGRGRPEYMLYSALIGGAATIALYFLLIPRYHEWGASIASTVSYVLTTVIVLVYYRMATQIPLRATLIPTRADVRNYLEAGVALLTHIRRRADRARSAA